MQKDKTFFSHNDPSAYRDLRKWVLAFLLIICGIEAYSQTRFEYGYEQMGTQIRLVFYAPNNQKADSLANLAFRRIDDLNNKLSDYLQESELNKLCKSENTEVVVSKGLYTILKEATQISKFTNGAFDVSAGPLVQLWRKARNTKTLPSRETVDSLKLKVGYRTIAFPKPNTISLMKKGVELDLGGIGKGFTADEVMKLLQFHGVSSALIDMGGDICVSDPPPDKAHWVLAFSYYDEEGKEVIQKIKLKNGAVATSGDLYQFVEIDGKRYSHIVNPITGWALTNRIQVTVIADKATRADAFASAFSVLGIEKTKSKYRDLVNLEVFMVEENGKQGYGQWSSPNFTSTKEQ